MLLLSHVSVKTETQHSSVCWVDLRRCILSSLLSKEHTLGSTMDGIAGLCEFAASLVQIPPRFPSFCLLSHSPRCFLCGCAAVVGVDVKAGRQSRPRSCNYLACARFNLDCCVADVKKSPTAVCVP